MMNYYDNKHGVLFVRTMESPTIQAWIFFDPSDSTLDEKLNVKLKVKPDYSFDVNPNAIPSYDKFKEICNEMVSRVFVNWFRDQADIHYLESLDDEGLVDQYPTIANALHTVQNWFHRPNIIEEMRFAIPVGIANAVYRVVEILLSHERWWDNELEATIFGGFDESNEEGLEITFDIKMWDDDAGFFMRYGYCLSVSDWLDDEKLSEMIDDIFFDFEHRDDEEF